MRHVPDEELHAYLDQALSRSQCAEIETHMAECARCSDRRDANAALRDRTTALLAQFAPRSVIIPPPYASLEERRIGMPSFSRWQRSARRAAIWAAGVVAAIGTGWAARSLLDPGLVPVPVQTASTAPASSIEPSIANAVPLATIAPSPTAPPTDFKPAPEELSQAARNTRVSGVRPVSPRRAEAEIVPAPVIQFIASSLPNRVDRRLEEAPVPGVASRSPFAHIWRSVQWEEALQIAGSGLPFIEGMPVVGVLLQPGAPGERPMVIVAQQDGSGEVIQSIEGPAAKVTELLQRQAMPDVRSSGLTRTPPDYIDDHGTVRRNNRMMAVTGRLSIDSLNTLARVATIR
jgi:hypothetical protein